MGFFSYVFSLGLASFLTIKWNKGGQKLIFSIEKNEIARVFVKKFIKLHNEWTALSYKDKFFPSQHLTSNSHWLQHTLQWKNRTRGFYMTICYSVKPEGPTLPLQDACNTHWNQWELLFCPAAQPGLTATCHELWTLPGGQSEGYIWRMTLTKSCKLYFEILFPQCVQLRHETTGLFFQNLKFFENKTMNGIKTFCVEMKANKCSLKLLQFRFFAGNASGFFAHFLSALEKLVN